MIIGHHSYVEWTCKYSWCGLIMCEFSISDILGASDATVMVRIRVVYKFVTELGSAVGATVVEVRLPARNELAMTLSR